MTLTSEVQLMDQILQRNIHTLGSARRQGEDTRKYLDVEFLDYLTVYGINIESEDQRASANFTLLFSMPNVLYSFIIS